MLCSFARLMRQYRLEARLSYRESDRRDQAQVLTWTRYQTAEQHRQAVKASFKGIGA